MPTKVRKFRRVGVVLEVTGHLWSGPKADHEYSLNSKLVENYPKTLREARSIAGDFESLTKARIVKTVEEVVETSEITVLKEVA